MNENGIITGNFITKPEGYQTCDLYLAAFFLSAGCVMMDSVRDKKNKRIYFVFEKNPTLKDLRLNYFSRKARIDALTFADNVKSLKSLCHNVISMKDMH